MKLIENIFMNYKIDYKKLYEEAQNEIKKLRAENKIKKNKVDEDDQEESIRERIIKDIGTDYNNLYDHYILDTEPLNENRNITYLE